MEKEAGELLLQEIDKLSPTEKAEINYTAVASLIAQEIAARAIRQSIQACAECQERLDD